MSIPYAFLSYDGLDKPISFRFQSVDDTLSRSVVSYEAPYTDGAYSDDLGASPRRITFDAVFRNEEYEEHKRLLNEVSKHKLLWTLQHPIHGSITGRLTSVSVKHSKYLNHCEARIEFIETIDKGEPAKYINIRRGEFIAKEILLAAFEFEREIEEAQSSFLSDIEGKAARLKAEIANIGAPINAITAGIKTLTGLPSELIGSCLSLLESVAALTESVTALPEMMTTLAFQAERGINMINDILNAPADFKRRFNAALAACYASFSSVYAGRRLALDEEERLKLLSKEKRESFDDDGRFTGEAGGESVMLSADELEDALVIHRGLFDKAIDGLRELPDAGDAVTLLSSQKRLFQDAVVSAIMKTGEIRTLKTPFPINIFTLLHREGLPYKACERVAALNKAPNPIFLENEVRIYAK